MEAGSTKLVWLLTGVAKLSLSKTRDQARSGARSGAPGTAQAHLHFHKIPKCCELKVCEELWLV